MNRIAEVMVSSVKPFQLMMGKIIGIAAVGLTQLLMWFILIFLLLSLLPLFVPAEALHQFQQSQQAQGGECYNGGEIIAGEIYNYRGSQLAADHHLLFVLFSFWIFILCIFICRCRQCGK